MMQQVLSCCNSELILGLQLLFFFALSVHLVLAATAQAANDMLLVLRNLYQPLAF